MTQTPIPNVTAGATSGDGLTPMPGGTYDPADAASGIDVSQPDPPDPPDGGDPEPDPEAVPQGTIANVVAWVGSDPARARAALDAENDSDKPRSSLVAVLEPIADA